MSISSNILYLLASNWSKDILKLYDKFGKDVTSKDYHLNYALKNQYAIKVKYGFQLDFWDKKVLEIGCGHGGIATWFAVNGAREVIGIDLNTLHLETARQFKKVVEEKLGIEKGLNLRFEEQDATILDYEPESFDIVLADNVFEHFMQPFEVMQASFKILKPGGVLAVPNFNSIYSKYGIHLKRGLRMPWANVFFSEKTICDTMQRLAEKDEQLYEYYPGLRSNPKPTKVKDLRRYADLNSITHRRFVEMANKAGFKVQSFRINPSGGYLTQLIIKALHKIPKIQQIRIFDILSVNANAVLVKQV